MGKIGIMGGTFNPVHNVHLIMAEEARRQFCLDKVFFMPSNHPPHKKNSDLVSGDHRKRMIQHAIKNNPYFVYSDMELKREGITYTKDTLKQMAKKYPEDELYFILGGDSLAALETWKDPSYVMSHCHLLVANRGTVSDDEMLLRIRLYEKKYNADISEIKMPILSISSEMLRKKLKNQETVWNYCPAVVASYIQINELYGVKREPPENCCSQEEILSFLSCCQKPSRFIHTLGVAATAANMASVHDEDASKAYLAGLLHDCAKYLTGEEQIQECQKAGIPLSPVELENTALIHGKLGAYYAQTKYGVDDEEILSAITYHTTGRPRMKPLEKIIYLADYVEPGRSMKGKPYSLEEIRKECFRDMDSALFMVLECSVDYLKKTDRPMDVLTLETYDFYKTQKG